MNIQTQAGSQLDFGRWQESLRRPIPALDGVRGLAILAVLAHQLILDHSNVSPWVRRLLAVPEVGWVGVQLFFVLSGFLITGILLETRDATNRWSSFFARRALRIFPPYYLLLTVLFCVLPRLVTLPPEFSAGLGRQSWYWLYLANWASLAGGGVSALAPCWSLSVEEQFYLLWPPLVFAVRQRTVVLGATVAVGAALATRTWIVLAGKNLEYAYEFTVARMDALVIGALTAILVRNRAALATGLGFIRRWGYVVPALLVVAGAFSGGYSRRNPVTMTVGHTVLAIASAYLILLAVRDNARASGWIGKALGWSPFRMFGKHSYAIYLFHHPLDMALDRLFLTRMVAPLNQWQYIAVQTAYFVLGAVLLLMLAMLFHIGFERPILNLKRHFRAQRPNFRRLAGRAG